MISESDVRSIGRMGKAHGVKGELTLTLANDATEFSVGDCIIVRVDGLFVPFFIEECRRRSSHAVLLRLDGIDSIDRARELTNCEVFSLRGDDDDDGGADVYSLVGWSMIDAADGSVIGEISDVDDTTANTLFVVDGRLVPAADEYIKQTDPVGRRLIVSLPHGLLEL